MRLPFAAFQSFYVLRHGETDANAAGIIQGSSDLSRLTAKGRRQAKSAGSNLARAIQTVAHKEQEHLTKNQKQIDQIFVSPLTRARDTLRLVQDAAPKDLKLPSQEIVMPNLREIDFYSWQDQTKTALSQKYPVEYAAWKRGCPDGLVVDGKQPLWETWARAAQVWKEIRSQPAETTTTTAAKLLVCHGTLGQALLGSAFGYDAHTFRRHVFPNCGMAEIVWHPDEALATSWQWHNICEDDSCEFMWDDDDDDHVDDFPTECVFTQTAAHKLEVEASIRSKAESHIAEKMTTTTTVM